MKQQDDLKRPLEELIAEAEPNIAAEDREEWEKEIELVRSGEAEIMTDGFGEPMIAPNGTFVIVAVETIQDQG